MKQAGFHSHVSPILALVAVGLAASALGLPSQPYLGMAVQNDRVASVVPGGPADRAGLAPGERLTPLRPVARAFAPGPLEDARAGRPLVVRAGREGAPAPVWLLPAPLPPTERRMVAALLAVAAGFVLLASLVWSERRDASSRAFVLLCLAFAVLLAPGPHGVPGAVAGTWRLGYGLATLALPALCLHFFALFPEPPARGARRFALVRAAWTLSLALFAGTLAESAFPAAARPWRGALATAAAAWFALGLLAAVAMFARSALGAATADARRRLRVAFAGTLLGVAPLAALALVRNLAPDLELPHDRWAVLLVLLVPGAFAWAMAVHRVFDFGVTLRLAVGAVGVFALGLALWLGSEWLGAHGSVALGVHAGGAVLAGLAVGAALAGPVTHRVRVRAARHGGAEAAGWGEGLDPPREGPPGAILEAACGMLAHALRLDGCAALAVERGEARPAGGAGALAPPPLARAAVLALGAAPGVVPVAESPLGPGARARLQRLGVRWLVRVGAPAPRAILALGRRLSGPWLGRLEVEALGRFAERLDAALETAALREDAHTRGAFARELAIAGEVQARRLPRRAPAYPTLDCAAATLSSEPVGGDYYDFVEVAPRDFVLAVGDAAGRGVPAAIILAGVQARFRDEARRGGSPGDILAALNRELAGFGQPDRFMGMLCARVDVRAARLRVANAGLDPPLLRRRDGRWETVPAAGLLLGVRPDARYEDVPVELGAGDLALLFTDGLTEARRGDRLFGVDSVRAVLERDPGRRAADALEALLRAVRAHAEGPLDDLTVVVLRQLTPAAAAAGAGLPLKSGAGPADARS